MRSLSGNLVLNQKNSMRGENRLYFFRIRTTVSPTSRNGPWAVPKSSESSARWLKLSPSRSIKICAILARFLDRAALIHAPRFYGLQCNPIECALTREENEKATA